MGDPTETALVRLGESYGFDEAEARGKYPRLAELPFDSDRKLMSTVHQLPDGLTMLTKGAVDVMLGLSLIHILLTPLGTQSNVPATPFWY